MTVELSQQEASKASACILYFAKVFEKECASNPNNYEAMEKMIFYADLAKRIMEGK